MRLLLIYPQQRLPAKSFMDVWRSLVQDIKFKDTSGEDRKLVPRTQTVKRKATPATNDTLESANVFRKANNIRVHGDNVPTPAQVRGSGGRTITNYDQFIISVIP